MWAVSLLQILDHMNAPDYAYGSIMKWAHDASADGYDFRKGIIEYVLMYLEDNISPKRMTNCNALVFRFHKSHCQTYRKTYP